MVQFHSLIVKEVKKESASAVAITFDVPSELKQTFAYKQGQHVTLRAAIEGEEVRRNYSICRSVSDNDLRIGVKKLPGGVFSTLLHRFTQAGDAIEVMPPTGRFFVELDETSARQYCAFAAGSGITPILSIIKTTLETEPASAFTLIYGNRDTRSIMFLEELEDIKDLYGKRFSLLHIVSREYQDVDLMNGRIDGEKILALSNSVIPLTQIDHFFICGPEEMAVGVKTALQTQGVDTKKIHQELFLTSSLAPGVKPTTTDSEHLQTDAKTVSIVVDGRKTLLSVGVGESILNAALKVRSDLPYACKSGVCCTCRARLVCGEVDMRVNYGLEDWEVEAGFVLTCQALPKTDDVVVDYDYQ